MTFCLATCKCMFYICVTKGLIPGVSLTQENSAPNVSLRLYSREEKNCWQLTNDSFFPFLSSRFQIFVWLPPGQPVNYNVIWDLLYAMYIITNKRRLLSVVGNYRAL